MRRLGLIVAAVAAAGLLIPLGSSGADQSAAAKAQAWLGTWDTSSGKLDFDDVYRKRSDCSACQPPNPYYWALEGRWDRLGKGWTKIQGSLSDKELGTFQGEWNLPKDSVFYRDGGWALIYRDGEKIRGAWKACPVTSPPGPKCPHDHFKGEKQSCAWKIGFRFTQRGHPDNLSYLKTQAGGAGSLVFKSEHDANEKLGPATSDSRVFLFINYAGDKPDIRVTIHLNKGELGKATLLRRSVDLSGLVQDSNSESCSPGAGTELTLEDGRGHSPDRINIDFRERCRIPGIDWVSLDKHRVNVNIELPHETQ